MCIRKGDMPSSVFDIERERERERANAYAAVVVFEGVKLVQGDVHLCSRQI